MIKLTDTQKNSLLTIGSNVKELLSGSDNGNTNKLLALKFIKISKVVHGDASEDLSDEAIELLALEQEQNNILFGAITSIGQSETMEYMNMSLDELETLSKHLQSA